MGQTDRPDDRRAAGSRLPSNSESAVKRNHETPKSGIPKRKKIEACPRLSCKIQYLLASNHSDQSTASEYFTADSIIGSFGMLSVGSYHGVFSTAPPSRAWATIVRFLDHSKERGRRPLSCKAGDKNIVREFEDHIRPQPKSILAFEAISSFSRAFALALS